MYANVHSLVTASGGLPGGEVWSCGLRTVFEIDPLDGDRAAADCVDAWTGFVQGADNNFSTGVTLTQVQIRNVDLTGRTTALFQKSPASPVTGAGAVKLPDQCALVLSLVTATAGRTGKGRIYLPLLSLSMGTDGKILPGRPPLIAPAAAALINAINLAFNTGQNTTGNRVAVQSKTRATVSPVTGIRIGDVVDTQRRRRDAVIETYATATVA